MLLGQIDAIFNDAEAWQVIASGQAEGAISKVVGPAGKVGLRLSYDFHGGGGFIVIRRVLPLVLPTTFEIGFQLRGDGPANHFECKVASPGGFNVWRFLRQHLSMPKDWKSQTIHERDMLFAWGPAGGGAPTEIEAIEFAIVAGPGGKGQIDLCDPYLLDQTLLEPASITASSEAPGFPAAAVFSTGAHEWRALTNDPNPWWCIDFGRSQRFGGLIIEWPDNMPPRAYQVDVSADGHEWQTLYLAERANGRLSHLPFPAAEARYLRLRFANAACAALRAIHLQPDAFSQTPNEFMHSVARDYPRGWHPRYWHREQSYWTPIGTPGGRRRALINEEGLVEVDEGLFSLEPFLITSAGLLTWAEMNPIVGLEDCGAPMPTVIWHHENFQLEILPWVDGEGESLTLRVTYCLQILTPQENLKLAIAVRPFEVNPPWQSFRILGGVSPIRSIDPTGQLLRINERIIGSSPLATHKGAALFEEGGVLAYLAKGIAPPALSITDLSERASAALIWEIPTAAGSYEVTISVPFFSKHIPIVEGGRDAMVELWKKMLGTVEWQVPTSAQDAFNCWRTCAGHILINRDGPAIQPGPRRYTRSWVRDCVIMGAALSKVGLPDPLRIFIEWYASFQRDDGFVPCVVDRDGIDWLVEHDSHGQFVWGIREVYRTEQDDDFLHKLLPHAIKAAEYLLEIRAQRMTEFYRSDEQVSRYGLLPESASHEGYLAHPVHSYWDDFWGIRGLQACADLCAWAGKHEKAKQWRDEAELFETDVMRSIDHVIADKNLHYIPGSVEWADFDPTATSNAIAMLDFADALPRNPLEKMLETYLDGFHRKHSGEIPWNNYTAYEIRIIGAFLRLEKRKDAQDLLEFFLSDRRPCAWNQWPEISWRDPRSPGHLGDVPHTWIAAEYIIALTSMVASERDATSALVLASGLPWKWIAEESGFSVRNLPTQYGILNLKLFATSEESLFVKIDGTIQIPPGGLVLQPPCPRDRFIIDAIVTDGSCEIDRLIPNTVHVHKLPLRVCLQIGVTPIIPTR
jgi:F5/8 type C domain